MEHLATLLNFISILTLIVVFSFAILAFLQGRVSRAIGAILFAGGAMLILQVATRAIGAISDSPAEAAPTAEAPALPDTVAPTPAPPFEFNVTMVFLPLGIAGLLLGIAGLLYIAISGVVDKRRDRNRAATAWAAVREEFKAAQATIGRHETDLDLQIAQPAFNDVNEPATAAMIGAYRTASTLMDSTRKDQKIGGDSALLKEARAAVADLTQKVAAAEDNARVRGTFWRSDSEHALLEDIQALLNQARHGTETMRLAAYRQAQKKVTALNRVIGATVVHPPAVNLEVEGSGLLALTAS